MKSEIIIRENGKKKAKLEIDRYGISLCTMRNGFQWSCCNLDSELIVMVEDIIKQFMETPVSIK